MKEKILTILISLMVIILIGITCFLTLAWMGDKISSDCEKQNNIGVIHYWDADVDCSRFPPRIANTST